MLLYLVTLPANDTGPCFLTWLRMRRAIMKEVMLVE